MYRNGSMYEVSIEPVAGFRGEVVLDVHGRGLGSATVVVAMVFSLLPTVILIRCEIMASS